MPIKLSMPDESPKGRRRTANAKGFKVEEPKKTGAQPNQPIINAVGRNYGGADSAYLPITRFSQFSGSGANVAISQPMFFSPMYTPQNWQIASRRKEIYQWARFYYENEPKVAAGVDFYAQFPMNGFQLECHNKSIRRFYEELISKLRLNYWLKLISHEYFLLGDVFPFLSIECKHCQGKGFLESGKVCNHPDGSFKSITILNPDFIEVEDSPFPDQRQIFLIPDEQLKRTVVTREPRAVYERIPDSMKKLIAAGQKILLSPRSVSHIKHAECPYGKYGTSMLRRLFTVLAYKTKLMTANWIVAERLVLPVRVVKLGEKDRPAGPEDIADMQQQIAAVANDPNLTIVTHHAFDYEWYGACLDVNTEILTSYGWKRWNEIDRENEIVATYNKNTMNMEFQKIDEFHEYDFKSTDTLKMYHFSGRSMDIAVTPNHRMLVQRNGKWETIYSQEVRHGDKFLSTMNWDGKLIDNLPYKDSALGHLAIDDYLKLVGYYISEGGLKVERNKGLSEEYEVQAVGISQNIDSPCYEKIANIVQLAWNGQFHIHKDERRLVPTHTFNMGVEIARHLSEVCGNNSSNKKIPKWVLDLPKDELQIVFDAMMDGDGCTRNDRKTPRYKYTTVSKELADNVSELLLKLGDFSTTSIEKAKNDNSNDLYRIYWSDRRKETPFEVKDTNIHREDYNDKVWCVKVPNTYIVTRRNGKITVQGNTGKIHNITAEMELIGKELLDGMMLNQALLNGEMQGYSSAQVGIETLIKRLETWRHGLADWVEEHIFKPTAMMQGFIDEQKTKEMGKTVYLYPTIKWNDMQLRDKTNKLQMYMQLHDKSLISTEKLMEEFDIDYDQEQHRLRKQQIMSSPGGAVPGGAGGGMPAGMDGGGGGGGGMPMDPSGGMGGAPGMDGGAGGMGGAPGGAGGAPMGGGGAPMGAAASAPPKIYKKGKAPKKDKESEPQMVAPSFVKLTRLEQKLWGLVQDLNLPFKLYGQYKQQVQGEQQPFVMDFAMPEIGVDIECLHPDQMVPTPDGVRPAKSIEVGSELIGRNGDTVLVEKKITHEDAKLLVALKAHGCLPILVTPNHRMLVARKKKVSRLSVEPTITRHRTYIEPGDKGLVFAGEIELGDFLMIPKLKSQVVQKEFVFEKYNKISNGGTTRILPNRISADHELGWLMGIYAAEGNVDVGGSNITFSFNILEVDYIKKTQSLLKEIFNLDSSVYTNETEHCSRVSTGSKILSQFLHDSFGQYAPNKKLPRWMFQMPIEFIEGFLEGYLDGDGCTRENGTQRYISSSVGLLSDLQLLLAKHGIFSKVCNSRKPGANCTFIKNGEVKEYTTDGLWELTIYPDANKKQEFEDENYFYVPLKSRLGFEYNGPVITFTTSGSDESNHTYCVGNLAGSNSDGEIWHEQEGAKERDAQRDKKLAQIGWRVIRFTEDAINEHAEDVKKVISENVKEAADEIFSRRKKASGDGIYKYAGAEVIVPESSIQILDGSTPEQWTESRQEQLDITTGRKWTSGNGAIIQVTKGSIDDQTIQFEFEPDEDGGS